MNTARVPVRIEGVVDPAFARVREVFTENFAASSPIPEIGAAVSACVDGRCVVDLWGGTRDAATGAPWQADTLANVWSTTKGVTATP